jgi:hypothetical protein
VPCTTKGHIWGTVASVRICRPVGAWGLGRGCVRGLAPLATDRRPFGGIRAGEQGIRRAVEAAPEQVNRRSGEQ